MSTQQAQGYMPQLDGLRGVAILAVMTVHFGLGSLLPSEQYSTAFRGAGLSAFFVLSGFLITESLLKQRPGHPLTMGIFGKHLLIFFMRRGFRIYPAYFFLILTLTIIGFEGVSKVAIWHYIFVANMDFARYVDITSSYALAHAPTAHLWSISVQEQFYLVLPLAIFLLRGRALVVAIISAILIAPLWRFYWIFVDNSSTTIHHLFALPSLLDTLLSGSLLALYKRDYCGIRSQCSRYMNRVVPLAVAITVLMICSKGAGIGSRYTTLLFDPFFAISIGYVIYNASNNVNNAAGRFLNLRILRFLGQISFGLYLYHAFAPHIADFVFSGTSLSPDRSSLLWVLTYIAISVLLAWASLKIIEKPALAFRSKIIHRIRSNANRNIGTQGLQPHT